MAAKAPIHVVDHVARGSITGADVTVARLALNLCSNVPLVVEVGILRQFVQTHPWNLLSGAGELEKAVQVWIRFGRLHKLVAINADAHARNTSSGVSIVVFVAI
jgi:hypothetical protein